MSKPRPKRFYKEVSTAKDGEAFIVQLDGRTLKTPGKLTLAVGAAHVADMIAEEWRAQGEDIRPETMPVTRLVNVALELTPKSRPKLATEARRYAATDLLCYRAEPSALARHQAEHWDPILAWAETQGITLESTGTIIAINQPDTSLDKIAAYAESLDDLQLTLFVHLTSVFGSAILALAAMKGHVSGSQAFDLSRLDARWQIDQWGEDEDDKLRTEAIAKEVEALSQIIGA